MERSSEKNLLYGQQGGSSTNRYWQLLFLRWKSSLVDIEWIKDPYVLGDLYVFENHRTMAKDLTRRKNEG